MTRSRSFKRSNRQDRRTSRPSLSVVVRVSTTIDACIERKAAHSTRPSNNHTCRTTLIFIDVKSHALGDWLVACVLAPGMSIGSISIISANSNDEDESFSLVNEVTLRFVMSAFEHGIQSIPIVSDECDPLDICADERSYLISFVYSQASG